MFLIIFEGIPIKNQVMHNMGTSLVNQKVLAFH